VKAQSESMTNTISALILSPGPESTRMFERTFADCHIVPETHPTSSAAQQALKEKDFDMLFVDFDEAEALPLLEAWNRRGPNTSKVAIAVSSRPELLTLAQLYEAQMVLQKPLRRAILDKPFKLATEIVMQKRRAGYRHSVMIKCSGTAHDEKCKWKLENVVLLDISRNGLCMKMAANLARETRVDLSFLLPETSDLVHVTGKVVRSESNGVAGVYFETASQQDRIKLESWLDARDPMAETVSLVDNPNEQHPGYRSASGTSYFTSAVARK
jgi:hypothetical protein